MKVIITQMIVPTYIVLFLPTLSANLPANGLDINADTENKEMISPLNSLPLRCVMKSFSSGRIKLKLVMNKNMAKVRAQKFLLYENILFFAKVREIPTFEHLIVWFVSYIKENKL